MISIAASDISSAVCHSEACLCSHHIAKLACSNTLFVLLAANPAANNLDAARVLTIATSFGFTIFVLVYIAAAFSGELKSAICEGLAKLFVASSTVLTIL